MATLAAKTTPKEYELYRKAMQQNASAVAGAATQGRVLVSGGIVTGGTGTPTTPRRMNNPIEKEN